MTAKKLITDIEQAPPGNEDIDKAITQQVRIRNAFTAAHLICFATTAALLWNSTDFGVAILFLIIGYAFVVTEWRTRRLLKKLEPATPWHLSYTLEALKQAAAGGITQSAIKVSSYLNQVFTMNRPVTLEECRLCEHELSQQFEVQPLGQLQALASKIANGDNP